MDLMELEAVLGLDTSGFESGIDKAIGKLFSIENIAKRTFGVFKDWFEYMHNNAVIQTDLVVNVVTKFGKDILETGLEYDKNLGLTFSVNNANETEKSLYEFTVLNEAAASTFNTADVAAEGFYTGLAGWDLTQASDAMHGIVLGAEAFGTDMEKSSDIVTDVVSMYGLEAEKAEGVVDTLAAGVSETNTDVIQLYNALKYVGPVAHTLGMDLAGTTTILGLFGDNAIKSGMAGRAFRNILTRISTNAGETNKDLGALSIVADKLGVEFFDTEGNARDLTVVFGEMIQAWQGMDEQDRLQVFDQFGNVVQNGKDADEVIKTFASDLDILKTKDGQLAGIKDAKEYEKAEQEIINLASQYDKLLELLNIPIPDTASEYVDALEQANIKLGLLSDKDKIYFGKQIAGMQGMPALLALLNTEYDTYIDKLGKISNAEGTAEKMREERLDNLAGDIDRMKSQYNALETSIYNDGKGPFRPIVQFATDAIGDVREAFENGGLEAGLDTALDKLTEFLERKDVSKIIETVGTVLGKILSTAITVIEPKIRDELAPQLAAAFFSGIGDNPKGNLVAQLVMDLLPEWVRKALSHQNMQYEYDFTAVTEDIVKDGKTVEIPARIAANLNAEDIQSAIDAALMDGKMNIDLGLISGSGVHWLISVDDAQRIVNTLGGAASDAAENFDLYVGQGVTDGAATGAVNADAIMSQTATDMANDIETKIGSAGVPAGEALADGIQSELSTRDFSIRVKATVEGLPGEHNAKAMNPGRIFRKPTIFGYANGAYQIAGDAGPEAVVGTNSLQRMIQNAVYSAIGPQTFTVPRNTDRPVNIVFELDGAQKWIYRLNKLEEQRVGMKLDGGVL